MLSPRLSKIAELVDPIDRVADIGSDHGYLGIACLEKGCTFLQAIENKTGPLDQTKRFIKPQNYPDAQIYFQLSDGLTFLDPQVDTVVISGMGGLLISDIIKSQLRKAQILKKLILQPNNKNFELRKFLSDNSFQIIDEEIVEENGNYYEIIVCRYLENSLKLADLDCVLGPILRQKRSCEYLDKWDKYCQNLLRLLDSHSLSDQKKAQFNQELNLIRKEGKIYEN